MLRMRRVAPALCVALLFGCGDDSKVEPTAPRVSLSVDGVQSVVGHIEIFYSTLNAVETYSFSALKSADNTVTGQWQSTVKWRDEKVTHTAQGRVTCFTIDGNTADLGGTFERFNGSRVTDREAIWTVVDNGEGKRAPADWATDLTYNYPGAQPNAADHCATGAGLHWYGPGPIEGNVQVRP